MKPCLVFLLALSSSACDGSITSGKDWPTDGGAQGDGTLLDAALPEPEHILFSTKRGFYDDAFTVTLSSDESHDEIRYTLDGRKPSATVGDVYSQAIDITDTAFLRASLIVAGELSGPSVTHSYIFPDSVFSQGDERPSGNYVYWTTEMDTNITEDSAYSGSLRDALLSIPTMSVVTSDALLFGEAGIHRGNNLMAGSGGTAGDAPHPDRVDEIEASIELIYAQNYERGPYNGFQVSAGLKTQGGGGRWNNGEYDHKQSFGLRFRRTYGAPNLKYPIFEDAPLHAAGERGKYDKLILRAGHNKSWGATWDNAKSAYTRDQLGRDLQLDMSDIGVRGTFVHLFLNGLYWGLYNITERPDDAHAANYLGGEEDQWYVGKAKGGTVDGDSTRFDTWRNGISGNGNFPELEEYLDVNSYLDMCLLNVYAATGDFPQYYFVNRNLPAPGPISFFTWDTEDAFDGGSKRTGAPSVSRFDGCYEFYDMWDASSEFRDRLAARATLATDAGGALSDASVLASWQALNAYIEDAMILESARWGDERMADTGLRLTRDGHWESARDAVTADLAGRAQAFLNELQNSTRNGTPYLP